jgi:hypothetical protein
MHKSNKNVVIVFPYTLIDPPSLVLSNNNYWCDRNDQPSNFYDLNPLIGIHLAGLRTRKQIFNKLIMLKM